MIEEMPDWPETLAYAVMPWIVLVDRVPWTRVILELAIALLAVLILHRAATRFLTRVTAPLPYSCKLVQYGHRAGGLTIFLFIAQVLLREGLVDFIQREYPGHLPRIRAEMTVGGNPAS
ncbi:MAG: hypothetical protein ACREX0_07650 [Noviherbaspirillum sp.]